MQRRTPTKARTKPRPCECTGWSFPHRLSSGNPLGKGECLFDKQGQWKHPVPDMPGIEIPELG